MPISYDPGPSLTFGWIIGLVFYVLIVVALWKVFVKAGYPGWFAIIPILNTVILVIIAGYNGWLTLLYSAVTDYELGLTGKLPFRLHLALDVMSAGLLIAAPFLFAFSDHVWVPHLVMAMVEVSVTAITLLAIVIRGAAGNSDHRTV